MEIDEADEKVPSWCQEYQRSWEEIPDNPKLLNEIEFERREQRRKKVTRDKRTLAARQSLGNIRRGMKRHLILIIDFSHNYFESLRQFIEGFILDYFDQNPISQLGMIATHNEIAQEISEMSGSASKHIEALYSLSFSGEPSLQNSLNLALVNMSVVPNYGSKEIIVIYGSLSTCDPGDIHETIDQLKKSGIRCSVVGWGAEVFILKKLAKETQGRYVVPLDKTHFKECLFDHSPPLPSLNTSQKANLVCMGFPQKHSNNIHHQHHSSSSSSSSSSTSSSQFPALCACHNEFKRGGYSCPRCKTRWCSLPVDCTVCKLPLVASPHLARSYHHLFPLPPFNAVDQCPSSHLCFSCRKKFNQPIEKKRYQCPLCLYIFCYHCDTFVHETLHNCPGCEMSSSS